MINKEDYPDFNLQLVALLKEKMKVNNISQREVARRLGISASQMCKYLGDNNYSFSSAQKLLQAVGYHPVLNVTKIKNDN
jgi:transcriptional regulator with XRE-family HTH domain